MEEIKTQIERIKELNQPEEVGFMIDSIIADKTPARVFVNDLENPTISLVWEGHSFFFGGEFSSKVEEVLYFMDKELLTDEVLNEPYFVKLYSLSDQWEEIFLDHFSDFKCKSFDRTLLQHSLEEVPSMENENKSLVIKEIDQDIFDSELENLKGLVEEIESMWGSVDKFLQDGFGTCAVKDNNLACWCTGEYFSSGHCGIGIETVEDYQGKGIATLTAKAFLEKCAQLNITPYWDSWTNNLPSVKVAEKLGFNKVKDYTVVGTLLVAE